MSRSKNARRKNQPVVHENCVTAEHSSIRERAILEKQANDKREAKQQYIVTRLDPKTTIYKAVSSDYKKQKNQIIHKGRIQ